MLSSNLVSSSPLRRKASPPSDLVPQYPTKKSRPSSPNKHDSGISRTEYRSGITKDVLDKLLASRKSFWEDIDEEKAIATNPRLFVPETLPEGYAWGSYMGGCDVLMSAHPMNCLNCGMGLDHETHKCPYKDSEEAKEFRKRWTWACPPGRIISSRKPDNE